MNALESADIKISRQRRPGDAPGATASIHRWCTAATPGRLMKSTNTSPATAASKVTYELIAKTAREMRLGRFRAGGIYRDQANQTRYQVSRVLKVGLNEYLVYLRPLRAASHQPTTISWATIHSRPAADVAAVV